MPQTYESSNDKKSTLTYKKWKQEKDGTKTIKVTAPKKPYKVMVMATTAGVGGIRLYDHLFH